MSIPEVQSRSRLLAFLKKFFAEKSSTSKAAPTDASYLTLGTNGDLSAERVLTAGTNISFTDGGAGGTLTINASGGGGGGGISWDGSTADGVATYKNASEASVEANLTFDGTTLAVAGTVGIGTTSPQADLHISDTGAPLIRLSDAGATTDAEVIGYTEYWRGENTARIAWAGFGSTGNEHYSIWNQTSNGSFVVGTNNTTALTVDSSQNTTLVGDLTVTGNDIKDSGGSAAITFDGSQNVGIGASPSAGLKLDVKGALRTTDFMEVSGNLGLKDDLIFGASLGINNIIDSLGNTRIYIDSGAHMSLVDRLGAPQFIVYDGYTKNSNNLNLGGNLVAAADATTFLELNSTKIEFIHAGKERIEMDGNGIGMLGATPIADGVAITGDLEPSGDVTVGGDLTAAGTVGIGTTSPQADLHISDTGTPLIRLSDAGATTDAEVVGYTEYWRGENTARIAWAGFGSTGNEHYSIWNQTSNGSFVVGTNNTTALTVDSSQNTTLVGDLTVTGNDIKGSGGTVITMDASNDVNLAGDLTVNGGDLFIKSTVGVADLFFRRETASLVDGDDLGNVIFQATENGTNIAWSPAVIKAECSETFVEGSNEGTRLKFLTTPNGTAASTTNMILDGNGNLDIDGALTLGAGVTSALGSEITTDLSTVDEWTKVAEADLNDPLYASYQMATATINVLLIGYEGSEEMYLATCNILAHKYGPTKSQLQVDIIQDEGSVAWDTSDFSLTQNTSVAELWVKAPAANHTCYATITNGTTGGNTESPSAAKSDWILTPNQTWGSLVPLTDTATTTNVKKRFDSLVIDSDLTMGAATSYIRDAEGHQRISIAGTGNIVLYDANGGTEFTVANGACTAAGNLTTAGSLFVQNFARIDGLRVGTTTSGPGDGNLYIEGITTAVGQIKPGWDPGIIAQTILDPSTATAFSITNSNTDLYRVIWSSGDTSTTDPKVSFTAPASGKVVVEVDCWEEDTSTGGSGPYVYLALSTSGDKTYIPLGYSTIVGTERAFWYAEQEQRGFKSARFYVTGLSSGATYIWYLFARRWSSSGGSNILRCGGAYPLFEMRVRPIYSNASIYNT